VAADDDFFRLGGDSLLALRLLAAVERRFGCDLGLASLIQTPTVEGQAALLEADGGGDPSPLLLQPSGEGTPLLLVHAAGGTVERYVPLARRLAGPVLGLQAAGLDAANFDGTAPAASSIEAIAADHLDRLGRTLRGPLRLGGWSLGGLVAFELARRRTGAGERVELLLLLDTVPPPLPPPQEAPGLDAELVRTAAFARDLGLSAADFDLRPEELQELDAEQRFAHLLRAAVRAGRLPAGAGADALRRRLAVYHATVGAAHRYRPREPWPGAALLVQAAAEAARRDLDAEAARWRELLPRLVVERLPADHHGLLRPSAGEALAARIDRGSSP
jgi:thioesterase domain-containing protein/aryl carrier-like protein